MPKEKKDPYSKLFKELHTSEDLKRYIGAVSEDFQDKLNGIADGLNLRIDVMREDMKIIKEDVAVLKEDVAGLKVDVAGLKVDVAGLKVNVEGIQDFLGNYGFAPHTA